MKGWHYRFHSNPSLWDANRSGEGNLYPLIEGHPRNRGNIFPGRDNRCHSQTVALSAGYQIDCIIRQHLWAGGFDYPGVATGHGVSHGLGVIEGGVSISGLKAADQMGLREGMIMTIG